MWQDEVRKHVRYNFSVNIIDAAFYGIGAMGLASFVTVIPLFLNSLHASTLLIGLVTSFHAIGWQLPQLFTAHRVGKLQRYKPFVIWMTIHERWPFIGLMATAILVGILLGQHNTNKLLLGMQHTVQPFQHALIQPMPGEQIALWLTVLMVVVFSLGGGLAATAWQRMIAKVMPKDRIGTFFGTQSGVANLMAAIGAVAAGFILTNLAFPHGYVLCFFLGSIAVFLSMFFLAITHEPHHELEEETTAEQSKAASPGWHKMLAILRQDTNFRWFLTGRVLSQFGNMALAFYTVYAVKHFGMDEATAGILTGVLLLSKTVASPLMGWMGDRWGHRLMLVLGGIIMSLSAALAISAPTIGWFYVIYTLAGFADSSTWTVTMTFTQEFGKVSEKPMYIGLANTLISPFALLAPFIGGALADGVGFAGTFIVSLVCGLLAALVYHYGVRTPNAQNNLVVFSTQAAAGD
ncbi:MAG: MFS transporter [Chloroflexi bacterium]|nr:MFS transporter [Chloroflexota bacterium]MCC6894654.1 MFS transporter [Anaerolineae bacterium]